MELLAEVRGRMAYFSGHNANFLLCSSSEINNLLNFLAAIAVGKKAVFAGKNITLEQKIAYAEKHNLLVVDFIPEFTVSTQDFYPAKEEDLFLGVLTSGSTGIPKIIWKDYQAWFNAFEHQSEVFGIKEKDKVMVVDALGYSANLNTVLHTLWTGATIVFTSLQDARHWPELVENETVSSVFLVPSHYRLLPYTGKFPNVKSLVSAGEKLDTQLALKLMRLFPNANLTEYYGAAELGHISYIQNQDIISRPTSVGTVFPGVSISIKDEKIWVSSPYVSPEYRSKSTVLDIGFIDSDGYLCVLGREGRMYNRRGLNIFAEEIENAAKNHPLVLEAVLIESSRKSAHLDLLIVCERPISQVELKDFLLRNLPKEKLPNRIVFTESIPRSPSGKIDFKVLSKRPVEEESFS